MTAIHFNQGSTWPQLGTLHRIFPCLLYAMAWINYVILVRKQFEKIIKRGSVSQSRTSLFDEGSKWERQVLEQCKCQSNV